MTAPAPALPADVRLVRADNPGVMTLDGTNTWVVGGADAVVVVDPGPLLPAHQEATREAVAGRPVAAVVLTHHHADHSEAAPAAGEAYAAPVLRPDDGSLSEATDLPAGLRVVATPGHTRDSVCLVRDDAVWTGDTVLGRGTTVVAHPDGALGPYLASLRLLEGLGRERPRLVLPGHGPVLPDLAAAAAAYLAHREQRLQQVREAVAGGAGTPEEVVAVVYADLFATGDRALWPAAEASVRAQLDWLAAEGA